MREIKFRAWDGNFNKMIYSGQLSVGFDGRIFYGNADMTGYPMEINQYTGLKDKNGKEIYEGDVCETKIEMFGKVKEPNVDVVEFRNGSFKFCDIKRELEPMDLDDEYLMSIKVLGNQFENPELLKG